MHTQPAGRREIAAIFPPPQDVCTVNFYEVVRSKPNVKFVYGSVKVFVKVTLWSKSGPVKHLHMEAILTDK